MNYQIEMDKIFNNNELWEYRTLRTLFDLSSFEYSQTDMLEKIEILNTIRRNNINLEDLISEYQAFYISIQKDYVAEAAESGLVRLLNECLFYKTNNP